MRRGLNLIFKCLPKLSRELMFTHNSTIRPWLPKDIQHFVGTILTNQYLTSFFKSKCYRIIVYNLVSSKRFGALVQLFQPALLDLFVDNWNERYSFRLAISRNLYKVAKIDSSNLMNFVLRAREKLSWSDFRKLLSSLLSQQLTAADLDALILECSHSSFLVTETIRAIGKSCTLRPEHYDINNYANFYHLRNTGLVSRLENLTKGDSQSHPWIEYARLLNEIRFNPQFTVIDQEIVSRMLGDSGLSARSDMLVAAVYANKPKVFQTIRELPERETLTPDLKDAIIYNPQFAKLYLGADGPSACNDISIMLQMVKWYKVMNIRHTRAEISRELFLGAYFVLVAEIGGIEELIFTIEDVVAQGIDHNSVIQTTNWFIEEFDNPVPFVNAILLRFKAAENFFKRIHYISMTTYLLALFSDASNISESCQVLANVEIRLGSHFLQALFDCENVALIKNIGSEQARPIREHFHIDLREFVWDIDSGLLLLRLFSILQIPIIDWSFSAEIDQTTNSLFNSQYKCFCYKDLVEAAKEAGFLSNLILWMYSDEYFSPRVKNRIQADNPNPFIIPFWDLFALWYDVNADNFRKFAPPEMREIFAHYSECSDVANTKSSNIVI